jgi:RNA polymerase sigma-70 factor (ECF subfamily)
VAEQIALSNLHSISLPESANVRPIEDQNIDIERRWVQRAKGGDLDAFDWLMARYRDKALRLAAHVLRRPAEAEDVVQESFLRAFSQIRTFRSDCSFYTWFYRIVVRLCLNRMRTPEWRNRTDVSIEYSASGTANNIPGPSETRALVENLLDQLTPVLRATLVLREVTGLEYEEIAQTLDIPVGTVRSRLNAARYQFRALWEAVQEETNNV